MSKLLDLVNDDAGDSPTLDAKLLLIRIRRRAFYPVPLKRADLMALTPQAVPHDGIDLAYTAADISQMHALLKQRGHFQFPMRCVLNRCDWDLIHNFVAPQMDQLSQLNPATHAALLRLLVKVHEQREWCDKFPTLLQGSDTDKTPVMLNWRGFQVRDQGT